MWVRPGAKVANLAQEVSAASEESVLSVVKQGVDADGTEEWQTDLLVDQVIERLDLDRDATIAFSIGRLAPARDAGPRARIRAGLAVAG